MDKPNHWRRKKQDTFGCKDVDDDRSHAAADAADDEGNHDSLLFHPLK